MGVFVELTNGKDSSKIWATLLLLFFLAKTAGGEESCFQVQLGAGRSDFCLLIRTRQRDLLGLAFLSAFQKNGLFLICSVSCLSFFLPLWLNCYPIFWSMLNAIFHLLAKLQKNVCQESATAWSVVKNSLWSSTGKPCLHLCLSWCSKQSFPDTISRLRPAPACRQELDTQSMNLYGEQRGKTSK